MLISKIKPNPDNPRYINADDFNRLVVSILIFPEMLRARGLVIKNKIVVGGNARLQAIRHIIKMNASTRADLILVNTAGTDLDYGSLSSFWNEIATTQQIPDEWVVDAGTWTEDQIRQFIIKDNTHFGAWDKEAIANAWNSDEIRDWGVDVEAWVGPGRDSGYEPNLKPSTTAVAAVTDDDIAKTQTKLENKMNQEQVFTTTTCPNCGHDYQIQI